MKEKKKKKTMGLRPLLKEKSKELYGRFHASWKFSQEEYLQYITAENYTDHGEKHVLTIEKNISILLTEPARNNLSGFEMFCLLSACSLHDIGMIIKKESNESIDITRAEHHVRARSLLKERYREFHLNQHEAAVIGEICCGHGLPSLDELEIQDWSVEPFGNVNVLFLTALLRIGDLLDLCYLRAPSLVAELKKIKGVSLRHWKRHSRVSDIKIDHQNKEIVIYAAAESEHDLSELYTLKIWVEDELRIVKNIFKKKGIFLDRVFLRTNLDRKRVLAKENPFLKLDSFDWAKHVAFFGRDREIKDIQNKLNERKIMILVGESGVGKTSLLSAGLKQKLIENGIYVFESRISDTFCKDLLDSLVDQFSDIDKEELPIFLESVSMDGFELVIFIDQFEEIFTLFREKSRRNEILVFIEKVLTDIDIKTKIVLSLREDFLAELWEVSEQIPALYDRKNTYRLKKLTRVNAEQIIVNTLNHINYSIEDELLERLLDDFTQQEESIYPPYIQIVCHEIFKKHRIIYGEKSEITPLKLNLYKDLGGSEKIISDYFDEILDGFTFQERTVINEIMNRMITFFYTKQRISYEQILEINDGKIDIDKTLDRLIYLRIIKKIETDINNQYELIHDFLAEKIMQNKPKQGLSSKITKAMDYIDKHFHEQISLKQIAEHVGVSREHFSRLFRAEIGSNFVDYLNKRRVEEAEKYLKKAPRIKLSEVYTRVGFTTPQHFTKVFKVVTGLTPREYRRKVLNGEL
jgi:YesN/AraC family two-component response regulator